MVQFSMEGNLAMSNYIAFAFIIWLSNSTEGTLARIWNTNDYFLCGSSGQATPKYATLTHWLFWIQIEKQPVQEGHSDPALFPLKSRNLASKRQPLSTRAWDIFLSRDRKFKTETTLYLHSSVPKPECLCQFFTEKFIVSLSKQYKSCLL